MQKKDRNQTAFCAGNHDNSAFVFIKPHANTPQAQAYVKEGLKAKGINILKEGEITGEKIDKDMLIDQHYYAIASKATLVKADKMPVDPNKFEAQFKVSWLVLMCSILLLFNDESTTELFFSNSTHMFVVFIYRFSLDQGFCGQVRTGIQRLGCL